MTTPDRSVVPFNPATVTWRYMGAHTVQRWEKREAWIIAAALSAGCTVRSALSLVSADTVGYT